MNKLRNLLDVAIVRAPFYGQRRRDMLEDIAVLTGGKVVTENQGTITQRPRNHDLPRKS